MLYEEDYLAWTQQQIGLLQTGNLEELDLKNLGQTNGFYFDYQYEVMILKKKILLIL